MYMEERCEELVVILSDNGMEGLKETKGNLAGVLAEIRSRTSQIQA